MKYAVCNELFGSMPLQEAASVTRAHGFHGLELSPFTLFGDFSTGAIAQGIASARRSFAQTGLEFAGFHWLFAKPEGLHITTPDRAVRRKAWDHLRRLLDAAAELGGGNLILGSPRQRSSVSGQSSAQAVSILRDELASIAPYAAERRSVILLEALSSDQTDVVNLLDQAEAVIDYVSNPGVSGMFDFHNCTDETSPYEGLIEKHIRLIRHVHLNDADGNHPRPGDHSYLPAFAKLRESKYAGWVSLEIFTTPSDPALVLRETMEYVTDIETSLQNG